MKFLFVAMILGVFPLTAISQENDIAVFERLEKIDQFVWNAPLFLNKNASSLQTARSVGKLQHEEIKKEPNQYIPDEVLEYRTLKFDGLVIYGRVEKGTEFLPITITISKDTWRVRDNLNVGTSTDHIREILGSPMKITGDYWEFQGESERVRFFVNGKTITKIELIYYEG
jgi:hypothetical protein